MLQHVVFFITAIAFLAISAFTPEHAVDNETATLSGIVVDAESEAPISNATVILEGNELVVVTDTDGLFEFGEVSVGEHELVVQADGYLEKARIVTLKPGNNEVALALQADD